MRSAMPWTFAVVLLLGLLLVSPVGSYFGGPATVGANPWPGPEPSPTNLTVFLHNSSAPVSLFPGLNSSLLLNTTSDTAPGISGEGQVLVGALNFQVNFYLWPALPGALVLNGTPTAHVFVNQTGSTLGVGWNFDLYQVCPGVAPVLLGSGGGATTQSDEGSLGTTLTIPYTSPLNTTVPAGCTVEAHFDNGLSSSNSDHYGFWYGQVSGTYYQATVSLPASTYLNVDRSYLALPNGTPVTTLNVSALNPVVNLTANLSDPLGNYDYQLWTVDWTIFNATGRVASAGTLLPVAPAVPPLWNGSGETYSAPFNYSGLLRGEYSFCVNATDNTYHNFPNVAGYFGREASGCSIFWVGSRPYPVSLTIVDSLGHPLVGAQVIVNGMPTVTGANGTVQYFLSNGTYPSSRVFWEGIQVNNTTLTVSGPGNFTLGTAVYFPVFRIVDNLSLPLSDAFVYVVHPNGTHYPLAVTNSTGEVALSQVPGGPYGLTVIWHDSIVYSSPPVLVQANGNYTVQVAVYHQNFLVVEPSGLPVPLASVVIVNATTGVLIGAVTTNSSGENGTLLPSGAFDVAVYWQNSEVANYSLLRLPATTYPAPFVITVDVFSVTFLAVDSEHHPVAGAVLSLTTATGSFLTLVTNGSGEAQAVLIGGAYQVSTLWDGVGVGQTSLQVNSSNHVTLTLAIYYLTVTTNDRAGAPLSGVFVQVTSTQTGTVAGTAISEGSPMIFRLPAGNYLVNASYSGTYELTPVSQHLSQAVSLEQSQSITLAFSQVNPSFTQTNEFLVLVGLAILALIVIVLALLLLRRRKGHNGSKPSTSETASSAASSPASPTEEPKAEVRSRDLPAVNSVAMVRVGDLRWAPFVLSGASSRTAVR